MRLEQRLEAEDAVAQVLRTAVATGTLADGRGQQVYRQWQAIAYPQREVAPRRTVEEVRKAGLKVFSPPK